MLKYLPILLLLPLVLGLGVSAAEIVYVQRFDGDAGGWSLLKHEDGAAVDSREALQPGLYCAKLEPLTVIPGEVLAYEAEIRMPSPLRQGRYRIGVAIFGEDGGIVALKTSGDALQAAAEWTKLRYVFKVPEGGAKMQLRLLHNGIGKVLIRKVEVRRPAEDGFERMLIPRYAGTVEEKKILHDWSLKCSGEIAVRASLDYHDRPEAARYSVCMVRDNPFDPDAVSTVESIVEDSRPVPAPLREIAKVTLHLRKFHQDGAGFGITVRFGEVLSGWGPMKNHWVAEVPIPGDDRWHRIELLPEDFKPRPGRWGSPQWQNVDGMYFFMDFSGLGEFGVKVAGVEIRYADGTAGRPFAAWQDPYWYFPVAVDGQIRLPELQWKNVHGSGIYYLDSPRGRNHFLGLQGVLPNLAIQSNVYLRNLLSARQWLASHGMTAGYQNATPYLWQAAVEHDALAVPLDGYEMLNERHHKQDYTSERWNEIWKTVADRFGKYGIPEYQTIDSNFRVQPEIIDRSLPAILNERDGGIVLPSGKVVHFWEYFESYAGRRWQPSQLGYESWDEHRTVPVNLYASGNAPHVMRRRGYLDMAVRHYCFVRFYNGAARQFARNKVRFVLMNNGDDWRNGNDWLWNVRSLCGGGFVDENYFYHPRTVLKAWHLGLAHKTVFEGSAVHHRLIGESGKGGHGAIYWAPEFSYAALFAVNASTRYDSFEMDWPSEELFENLGQTGQYQYNRFRDYWMKSIAYNHAAIEDDLRPAMPMERVISLQETRAMYAGEHPRKLAVAAEKHSLPVSRIMPGALDDGILGNASIIINDCYALPEGMAGRLLDWVRSGKERALLLHGVGAGRKIDGTMWSEAFGWNKVSMNAPEQFGDVLGRLRFRQGRTFAERKGEVLLSDANGEVLSFYPQGNGSGIYFYSQTPGIDPNRDFRILKAVFKRHDVALPLLSDGNELYVRGYHGKLGTVFAVFDKKSLDTYKWVYSADDNGLYPWKVFARVSAETAAVAPGSYRLFGMLSGSEREVRVNRGDGLRLELRDVTAEIYYLLRHDDHKSLEKLRRMRTQVMRFPERPDNGNGEGSKP